MKNILLACAPSRIDSPLRRSLAHLAKSCQIDVAHDGHLVFEELYAKAFDLIIIDFVISGVDSLELVESIQYIDSGIPVILMIPEAHKAIANTARQLKAQPIIRPFKPLTFLRLVDQLLHQHLNRYRQLVITLQNTVGFLRAVTNAACTFLVEETGQVLTSNGEANQISLEALANLTVQSYIQAKELGKLSHQDKNLYVSTGAEEAYHLYTTAVAENLYLALIMAITPRPCNTSTVWVQLDKAAGEIRRAFQSQTGVNLLEEEVADSGLNRIFIPLKPSGDPIWGDEPADLAADTEDHNINWQFITQVPALSNRLHNFCRAS